MIGRMSELRRRTAGLLLGAMLRYAEADVCRRRVLLEYFGEPYRMENCGMCDNCLAEPGETRDLSLPAQKLLSCVKRTGESFGVEYIIDVLRGAKSQKVAARRHDRLSTYGIGTEYSRRQWRHLARQLLQHGFMVQDMEYGGLRLTTKSWALFRDQCRFRGSLPEQEPSEETKPGPSREARSTACDPELFALLRKKRKLLADEGGVPPFVIFSDRTLIEMAARLPLSNEALRTVHGVGQVKEQRYGEVFLDIIRQYCGAKGTGDR